MAENIQKNTKKKFSTTKLIVLFLFINCTLLEIFTGWVTIQSIQLAKEYMIAVDFTPLVTLIGVVVGEVLSFGVYAAKTGS